MTKQRINGLKELVQFKEKESFLLMPNEVIPMIVKCEQIESKQEKAKAISFAYTYLFISTWMYRYAKYGVVNMEIQSVKGLKRLAGISETTKTLDFIIKKNGMLDQLGLTETIPYKEAPIKWGLDENNNPVFEYFKSLDKEVIALIEKDFSLKRRQLKKPLLATNQRKETLYKNAIDGTFFDGKDYTHNVDILTLFKCLSEDDLGVVGFYLHCFLNSRIMEKSVQISIFTIAKESGLSEKTVVRYLKALRQYGLIEVKVENFIVGKLDFNIESEANTYSINSGTGTTKEEITTRKVVSVYNFIDDDDLTEEQKKHKNELMKKSKIKRRK